VKKRQQYDVWIQTGVRSKCAMARVNKWCVRHEQPKIPTWLPFQLRHTRATELNELAAIEAAAVHLYHAHADVIKVYEERNLKRANDVARKAG